MALSTRGRQKIIVFFFFSRTFHTNLNCLLWIEPSRLNSGTINTWHISPAIRTKLLQQQIQPRHTVSRQPSLGGRQQNVPPHAPASGEDVALRGGRLGENWQLSQEAGVWTTNWCADGSQWMPAQRNDNSWGPRKEDVAPGWEERGNPWIDKGYKESLLGRTEAWDGR